MDRRVVEMDAVLIYILKVMRENGILLDLAFKGGKCIRKIYLGRVRITLWSER